MNIKFRLWDETLNRYIDLYNTGGFNLVLGYDGSIIRIDNQWLDDPGQLRAEMFTGVRCFKTGREIYLNDIIELYCSYTGDIIYEREKFQPTGIKAKVKWGDGRFFITGPSHSSILLCDQPIVLIGNINQNPELL